MPEKRDWVTPVCVLGGGVAVAAGAYMLLKKPPAISPGGAMRAHFVFDYMGYGGAFVIQVSLGHIRVMEPLFDHIEGMTWTENITLPDSDDLERYEFDLDCEIPPATEEKTYDAEALIRTPSMDELDYLIKDVTKNAIRIG